MKKIPALIMAAMLALSFAACSASETSGDTAAGSDAAVTAMIATVLVDGVQMYAETKADLTANNAKNIGSDGDRRKATRDGVRFSADEGKNPIMALAMRIDEAGNDNNLNQAFYMKFKPSSKDFGFMLCAQGNAGLTIGEDGRPALFVMEHDYMETLDTDLKIEPNCWYHVLIGIGGDGLIEGAIWKDGEESDAAYLNLHISKSFDDDRFAGQSWQVNIGFQGKATFTIAEYAYYTFSNFVMPDRLI